jgi:hypothetical protein
MTVIGGVGHTLPFVIGEFQLAVIDAVLVVVIELGVISWVRHRDMDPATLGRAADRNGWCSGVPSGHVDRQRQGGIGDFGFWRRALAHLDADCGWDQMNDVRNYVLAVIRVTKDSSSDRIRSFAAENMIDSIQHAGLVPLRNYQVLRIPPVDSPEP